MVKGKSQRKMDENWRYPYEKGKPPTYVFSNVSMDWFSRESLHRLHRKPIRILPFRSWGFPVKMFPTKPAH